MAPQNTIPLAADVLGTIGTVLWCVQLIPQIWKNWRKSSTEGVTGTMFLLWASACPIFGAYAIVQNFTVPIQIQPNILCGLCLIGWGQTLFYHNKLHIWKVFCIIAAVGSFGAGLECLLVFVLRKPYERGIEWPVLLVGVLAAVFLISGLLPPYYEMSKRSGRVVGISFKFLSIDIIGAFFSLLALAVQHSFDLLGGILYIIVLLLELGICGSQLVWLYRTRKVRKAARAAGQTYDEYNRSLKHISRAPSCTTYDSRRVSQFSKNDENESTVYEHRDDLELGQHLQKPEKVLLGNGTEQNISNIQYNKINNDERIAGNYEDMERFQSSGLQNNVLFWNEKGESFKYSPST